MQNEGLILILDQQVWHEESGVYSVYRLMNGHNVNTQTIWKNIALHVCMYIQGRGLTSMNYRPCNYSEVCAYLDFFLLLVSTTLKSIFGPLSHVEWERLILSI